MYNTPRVAGAENQLRIQSEITYFRRRFQNNDNSNVIIQMLKTDINKE